MPENTNPEDDLFEAALLRSPGPERAAFLDGECRSDPELRARVELMLEGHLNAQNFLETLPNKVVPERTIASAENASLEQLGGQIGPYKLLEKLGEGGCGVVYLAEQDQPVRRRVALKVIKLGMDTRSVIARFEAERQALALMDHPNIAKVFDAGTTETGRPYFVMELVRGIRISEYCDQNNLTTGQRLSLFIQVCQAIQHAHQKGIIHRDIKPSNILITLHDGVPVPKVIDFGIAKATCEQRLTDKTIFTAFEQFIGTPAYMSPEQAEMSGLDIDTRSDIYSLGVLLYELLTGSTPFDAKELLASGLDAMRKTIREKEPVRPSTKLNQTLVAADVRRRTSGDAEESASSRRRLQEQLHQLQGDLDWIIMKCLEKDRTRRYETANGLASDIQRHFNNEPVVARPPSTLYRFQKLVRRNKLAFAGGSALGVALVLGTAVSTWQAIRATHFRRQAQDQAGRAEAEALTNRQNLYAADMNLANLALETHNLGRFRALLEKHVPKSEAQSPKSADDLRGWEWRYLYGQCHSDDIGVLARSKKQVSSVCFSPDGRLLAAAGDDGLVRLWDFNTRAELPSFETFAASLDPMPLNLNHSVAFSPDGRRLAAGGPNRDIRIWDVATREQLAALTGHTDDISSIAFSPDGKLLASASFDGTVRLWDLSNQHPHQAAIVGSENPLCVAFSRDGNTLVVSARGERVKLYNISKPESPELLPQSLGTQWIVSVAFSPDGRLLALSGAQEDSDVHLYEFPSLRSLPPLRGHAGVLTSVAFSPDGRRLASTGSDRNISLWTLADPDQTVTLMGHDNCVMAVAFSPDGKTLVSGSNDGTVRLWNPITNSEPQSLYHLGKWVAQVAFSPDSKYAAVLAGGNPRPLTLWDVAAGREIGPADFPTTDGDQVAFSPDGKTVCASSKGRTSFYRVPSLQWITNEVADRFLFAPDGSFAILLRNGNITRRDLATGAEAALGVYSGVPNRMAISPDGRTVALSDISKAISLWDTTAPGPPAFLNGHTLRVVGLAFSPDGKLLASASLDGGVMLWDVAARRRLTSLRGHPGMAWDVAFSPDGRTLASSADDGTIKLWNLASFQEAATLHGHKVPVSAIAFSPDGKELVSAGWAVRLWHAPTFEEIAAAGTTKGVRR